MNKTINLVVQEEENLTKKRILSILRPLSLGLLALIVFISVGLFFSILVSPLPALRNEENSVSASLRQQQLKTVKLYYVKERLGTIGAILSKRSDYGALVQGVTSLLPSDVVVTYLIIQPGSLQITVSSPSLLPLKTFIDAMKQAKTEKKTFRSITLSELSYDKSELVYKLTLTSRL